MVTWRRGTCNRLKRFKTAWGHYMTYTLALILRWHKKWFKQRSHTESSWSGTKQTDWTDWALLNPCLSDSIKIIDFYQIRWRTLDLVRLSYISSFFCSGLVRCGKSAQLGRWRSVHVRSRHSFPPPSYLVVVQ